MYSNYEKYLHILLFSSKTIFQRIQYPAEFWKYKDIQRDDTYNYRFDVVNY